MSKKSSPIMFWIVGIVILLGIILLIPRMIKVAEMKSEKISSETLSEITAPELLGKIKSSPAKVKLLNVWATWCGPCVAEFPVILEIREKYKDQGFELYFVSTDMREDRDKVEEFLKQQKIDFMTFLKAGNDSDFIEKLHGEWSGALPASFVYDAEGNLVNFWTGDATFEEFEEQIKKQLN